MAYQSINPYDGKILKTFEELCAARHARDGQIDKREPRRGGAQRYHLTLGPLAAQIREVRFRCTHPGCDGTNVCCQAEDHLVRITSFVVNGE